MTSDFSHIPLTLEMIEEIPLIDIHVHLPGTISPQTAWELGVRNKFITVLQTEGKYSWKNGPNSLCINDPFEEYSDIFKKHPKHGIKLNAKGIPLNLKYNIDQHSFKSFDRIMATIQGHRHPPGGIQNENDLKLVLEKYLEDCINQKVFYTEIQQNIKIAHQLYPDLDNFTARKKFYNFLQIIIKNFKRQGVFLRFIHCFNKTQAAALGTTAHERAMEAYEWLKEAQQLTPGVFVGVESAGHEKDESGWPIHLKEGYEKIKNLGLGCEAHGGEGIGVEHMMDVIKLLPITRLAHGFQVIENENAIIKTKERDITLVMMPLINLKLGACLHGIQHKNGYIIPRSKSHGGKKCYITKLHHHPFFELLRRYKLKITLSSDNPHIAGLPIKEILKVLSDVSKNHELPKGFQALSANELYICCINGIESAFCEKSIKDTYKTHLYAWAKKYKLF